MASRLCRSWAGIASATLHGRSRPDISVLVSQITVFPALAVLFGASGEVTADIGWMTSEPELASAWAAIGWDLGLPEERIFESSALKYLDVASHTGRLALLWLEKRASADDD
jgi:hypothetical protein